MPGEMAERRDASRLYVIGDIHGRSDLLDKIAVEIKRDFERRPDEASLTVTVGDYVDRGPDSRGVIERLIGNPFPTPYVALKGNHEELFLSFLNDPSVGSHWRHLGGLETLHSYGVGVTSLLRGEGFEQASEKSARSFARTASGFLLVADAVADGRKVFHLPCRHSARYSYGASTSTGSPLDPQ